MHSIDSAYSDRCSVVCVCACVSVGWARSTDVSATRRFDDRRFDGKPVDRQTFRRHGSDVSTTHFGRFADK